MNMHWQKLEAVKYLSLKISWGFVSEPRRFVSGIWKSGCSHGWAGHFFPASRRVDFGERCSTNFLVTLRVISSLMPRLRARRSSDLPKHVNFEYLSVGHGAGLKIKRDGKNLDHELL
jgi:hypothetical protein